MASILRAALISFFLLVSPTIVGQANDPTVPGELTSPERPAAWIAADVAIGPDGSISTNKLKAYAPAIARHARVEASEAGKHGPTDRCATRISVNPERAVPRSAEALVARAATIVRGRIVGVREGFYHGTPGSLLRLEGTFLRGNPHEKTYLFYPMASIATSEGMVCSRPPKRYGAPQVGDEIIVFDHAPSPLVLGDSAILFVNVARSVVYIPRADNPILPDALMGLSATDDLISSILRLIATDLPDGFTRRPRRGRLRDCSFGT